jgi:hypothetical protein
MIRTIFTFLLLLSTLAHAQSTLNPYQTTVSDIQNDMLLVPDNPDIALGATGVVLRHFKEEHETIIARVEVMKREDNQLILAIHNFELLPQSALPAYRIPVTKGDSVILNFLYERALAIAPNKESYKAITQNHPELLWVHPDLFASQLSFDYNPSPSKKDFQTMCIQHHIGLLFFSLGDEEKVIDCKSFKTVQTVPLSTKTTDTNTPFYHRLKEISGRVFGLFGGKEIKDYQSYYQTLLKDSDAR